MRRASTVRVWKLCDELKTLVEEDELIGLEFLIRTSEQKILSQPDTTHRQPILVTLT